MNGLTFETPPKVSLLSAALHGTRDLSKGLPRLEASARRLEVDAAPYAAVCGYAKADPLPLPYLDVACRGLQFAVMTSAAFPFRLLGLVHVSQRLERFRPVGAGEALSARVWVEGFRIVRRGAQFELQAEVRSGDELVWAGTSAILSQSVPGDGVKREAPVDPFFPVEREARWALAGDQGRRYAKVSKDHNPIHHSALGAKLFGFPRAIIHGWWSLARCLAELDEGLAPHCVVEASFRKPVFLPSEVRFEAGRVDGSTHFRLRRDDGELALTGSVR